MNDDPLHVNPNHENSPEVLPEAEVLNAELETDDLSRRIHKVKISRHSGVVQSIKVNRKIKSPQHSSQGRNPFHTLSYNWMQSCLGFIEAFPLYGHVAHHIHQTQVEEDVVAFVERNAAVSEKIISQDAESQEITYEIDQRFTFELNRRISQLNQYKRAEKSFARGQLLAILAEYEAFIADLLRLAIAKRPEAFISADSKISVYEVIRGTDLNQLREVVIEDRIESLQRDSHIEQVKFIFGRLKLNLPDPKSLREFGEICERRNVITHGNGRVNRSYTSKLKELGYPASEIPEIGSELSISLRYLRRSLARVFQMGFFTLHIVWQHLEPEHCEQSVSTLVDAAHDFLVAGYTKISGRISEFILNEKSPANEKHKAYSIINLALSVYLDNDISPDDTAKRVEKILAKRDWSIVGPIFNLALHCVRGQHDDLPRLIDLAIDEGLTEGNLLTWALFTKARREQTFRDKIKDRFGIEIEAPTE
ncbi:hypothetical protein SAMN04488103_1286 [Gemmobacter aquatilis]|uniref:Uncharacterized protein n=1 Tax=Gemmobacter aquatilis TaxID=933059 RepID=A0A1H8P286_9RHOB|nr:hypothetical protein [Gemmobacter aquatilis]SEO35871.1 hypothetical protein SAMN04488103_1286 [Gemmobacter aquatilis]